MLCVLKSRRCGRSAARCSTTCVVTPHYPLSPLRALRCACVNHQCVECQCWIIMLDGCQCAVHAGHGQCSVPLFAQKQHTIASGCTETAHERAPVHQPAFCISIHVCSSSSMTRTTRCEPSLRLTRTVMAACHGERGMQWRVLLLVLQRAFVSHAPA